MNSEDRDSIAYNRIKKNINYSCLVSDVSFLVYKYKSSREYTIQRGISDVWLTFTISYIAYTHNKTANDSYGVMICKSYMQGRYTGHWCIPL